MICITFTLFWYEQRLNRRLYIKLIKSYNNRKETTTTKKKTMYKQPKTEKEYIYQRHQ